ncbi:MAG: multidrug efflux pump [Paraglaciecola sp.]
MTVKPSNIRTTLANGAVSINKVSRRFSVLAITYLILAAQIEKLDTPTRHYTYRPPRPAGWLYRVYFAGMSLNIYNQIGLVMLIGLAAKNGILIVKFANQLPDTLRKGSAERLRAIVINGITTFFSALPLVLATGVGAKSPTVIAMVIFTAMLLSAFMILFVVSTAYFWLTRNTGSPSELKYKVEALQKAIPYAKGEGT